MNDYVRAGLLAMALALAAVPAMASVTVGGAAMLPRRDIVENATNSKDHTILVASVKAAGLMEMLKGPGPFTVFAPTDAAFEALPSGSMETLRRPENKAVLTRLLTYHVVPGKLSAADLVRMIQIGHGRATLMTVAGETLTVTGRGQAIMLTDAKGDAARVTIANVFQSNGVVHVIDKVMLPS